jgi:hypothetical protein
MRDDNQPLRRGLARGQVVLLLLLLLLMQLTRPCAQVHQKVRLLLQVVVMVRLR